MEPGYEVAVGAKCGEILWLNGTFDSVEYCDVIIFL